MTPETAPYCGLPPLPEEVWSAWNLDPVLIGALVAVTLAYLRGTSLARVSRPTLGSGLAGLGLLAATFLSPLCALSMALFSARMGQHIAVTLAVAPLLVAGSVLPLAARGFGLGVLPRLPGRHAATLGTLAFALAFWGWHLPGPYALTLASDATYWLMQTSLLAAAILLWQGLARAEEAPGAAMLATLATSMQMALFSAFVFFSHAAWHDFHATTTAPFGMSPLEDQQLAAVLMWAPGALGFLGVTLALFVAFLRSVDRIESRPGGGR